LGAVDQIIAEALLSHQLDLLRLEAGVRARVIALLNQLQRELTAKLATEELTEFSKARTAALLKQATEVIDSYYARAEGVLDTAMSGAAEVAAKHAADTLDSVFVANFSASLPSATFLERIASNVMIQGAPSAEWWSRQSVDTAFRFANAVRQGIVAGETNETIIARVAGRKGFPGVMEVSRSNARALVHTSIQEVANDTRRETFRKNSDVINGTHQVSTLDSHTTDICMAYDGAEYDLDGEPINGTKLPYNGGCPRHWGCRSIEVPITKTFKELGIDIEDLPPPARASSDGPVRGDMTFAQFLERKGEAFQDEVLGPGRAQLWRDDKITLQQLLDLRGNPLTLEELRAKYE